MLHIGSLAAQSASKNGADDSHVALFGKVNPTCRIALAHTTRLAKASLWPQNVELRLRLP